MKETPLLERIIDFIKFRLPCYFGKHLAKYPYNDGFRCTFCDKDIPSQNK